MSEPYNEHIVDDQQELAGTSAVIDDVEVFVSPDQYPMADLSDLDFEAES